MSFWSVTIPEAGTNIVTNPSFELNLTGWVAAGSATLLRTQFMADMGSWCVQVSPTAALTDGALYAVTLAGNTTYTFSAAVATLNPGGNSYRLLVQDVTGGATVAQVAFTLNLAQLWQRQTLTFTTVAGHTTYRLYVQKNSNADTSNFFVDSVQLEQNSYGTTYGDGSQTGWSWTGTPHASTSLRSAQYRGGGRVVDFDTLNFKIEEELGTGMPNTGHISTEFGLSDGSLYQRTAVKQRLFTLKGYLTAQTAADLSLKRLTLLNTVKRDLVSGDQPVRLRNTQSGQALEIQCYYDGGLERGPVAGVTDENIVLRFIADDPFWYETGYTTKTFVVNENVFANHILIRNTDGTWATPGGGTNGTVASMVYDSAGNLYIGGIFTTCYNGPGATNPVTVANVAMWNGSVWSALGAGLNGNVAALCLGPDGTTVYAGGAFTNVGYPTLAQWTGVWGAVGGATGNSTASIQALTYSPVNGLLYVGGQFAGWLPSNAGKNNLVAYDTVAGTWSNFGGLSNGVINTIAVNQQGLAYIGGAFTLAPDGTAANRVAYQPTTATWAAIGTGTNLAVSAIVIDTANSVYVAGSFTNTGYPYIAKLQGASNWVALGTGINGPAYSLGVDPVGGILVGGAFSLAGGQQMNGFGRWTGSAWQPTWVTLVPTTQILSYAFKRSNTPNVTYSAYEQIAIGFNTTGTAITSNITDTVVNNLGSAAAAPGIVLIGPGIVESVVNTTTGKGLYFSGLTLQANEYAILDLQGLYFLSNLRGNMLGTILPTSDLITWRLQPGANTVLVKYGGGATGASGCSIAFRQRSWSSDG